MVERDDTVHIGVPSDAPAAADRDEEDGSAGTPRCTDCRRPLTWRDWLYAGAVTTRCKGCRAHEARSVLKGTYVKTHDTRLNHEQRRLFGLGRGEAMGKRRARQELKHERKDLRRERKAKLAKTL